MNKTTDSTNFNAVDLAKLVLALVIVCAHFASTRGHFPPLLDYGFSLYVIGVPFFFACSGFLLFRKTQRLAGVEKRNAIRRYAAHIAIMYLAWSAIYFVFVLIGWIQEQASAATVWAYFYKALVFSTYATIWFLPALLMGVLVVHVLSRRLSPRSVLLVALLFYGVGSLGYSYSFLLAKVPWLETAYRLHDRIFITTRNGLFNGFPFVALGAWMASRENRMPLTRSGLGSLLFLGLLVIEAFVLKLCFKVNGVDTAFSLLPFTFFFLEFLLALKLRDRPIFRTLRDLSILIFLSQRLYITALPSILPAEWTRRAFQQSYLALAVLLGLITIQSWFIMRLSDRYRILKVLR
jgi:peptidoglycan/LPS O-acetylase OafA/YrhL